MSIPCQKFLLPGFLGCLDDVEKSLVGQALGILSELHDFFPMLFAAGMTLGAQLCWDCCCCGVEVICQTPLVARTRTHYTNLNKKTETHNIHDVMREI